MKEKVSGPATALLVTGILAILLHLFGILSMLIWKGPREMPANAPAWARNLFSHLQALQSPVWAVTSTAVGLIVAALIIYGALQMKNLRSWGLSVAVSIIAMIPCFTSCCCILGLPFGIWALTVLYKPEVRQAFQ
jgi:hypothetical protein